MDFELQWLLLGLPVAFALGWLGSRLDLRHIRRETESSPRAYFKGLNLLLNEQQDKAIDAFIEAVQQDPGSTDLHFALGNLFRRRGEYERAVRVHQHLLARADLPTSERDRAQHALAQDYLKAGLFDRAEAAYKALEGTAFATDARLALLGLHESARDWKAAIDVAKGLESVAAGSFAQRIAHYWCELAQEADARGDAGEADAHLQRARDVAPQAARPWVLFGQRLARQGRHAEAVAAWTALSGFNPAAFGIVAREYATSMAALGRHATGLAHLQALLQVSPGTDLLQAALSLEVDTERRRDLLRQHLQRLPGLAAGAALLREIGPALLPSADLEAIQQILQRAMKPLQRYRCAACGFEAQQYFWQCPGCHGWDTYPPQRIEDS